MHSGILTETNCPIEATGEGSVKKVIRICQCLQLDCIATTITKRPSQSQLIA